MALLLSALGNARPSASTAAATKTRSALRLSPLATSASPLRPGALASSSLVLVGLRLTAPTTRIEVPKDAPFSVPVGVWIGDHQATATEAAQLVPAEATLTGTLTGPGISSPITVTGTLASGLSLPGLTAEGDFTLSDIRLVKGGTTVLEADPKTVTIHCLGDVIISSVSSSPMTMQEIRDAGIQLAPGNYEGRRFTMALSIGSNKVDLSVPVAVPVYNGLEDPRSGGGTIGRLEIKGMGDDRPLPDLSVVVADIQPEKDPFALSRPAISHTLRHNFKALIVIPGSIGYLHQFYKVNMVVFNALKEGSPFQITHLSTTLNLPPGADGGVGTVDDPLRIAKREGESDEATKAVRGVGANLMPGTGDPVLKAGETGMATFFVEALKEGSHQLNFDIRGQFEGGGLTEPIPLIGRAQGKLLVRNPNFNLVLVHPDVVRRGEEYTLEARLTNTSETLANSVTVTLDRARLGSVKLVEDLNTPVDTMKPGETAVFKFKLRALRNGEVRSSYLYMEQGTIGFQLSTGLGERNIRLNPDTLVLPQTLEGRKGLPEPLREAMLRVLGQAYSVATSKGALPPGVLPIATSTVTGGMSQDLSEQGLFLKMGIDKARVWLRLWEMFMQNPDPGFDQLVRTTEAGHQLRQAFLNAWTWADGSRSLGERLGEMGPWAKIFGRFSMAAIEGAKPGLIVDMADAQGNVITSSDLAAKALPSLGIPYAAWGGSETRHFIALPSPTPGALLGVANRGTEVQTLRVATVAPVMGNAPTQNQFEFELLPGQSAVLSLGSTREGAGIHRAPDGSTQAPITSTSTQDVLEEPFKVLAVHRYDIELNPAASPYGTHIMMLFNRPTMALNLPSGNAGSDAAKALVEVEANAPWLKVMAPDPITREVPPPPPALFKAYSRVASLYLERPVGPYVTRHATFGAGWTDASGNPLTGTFTWPIACGDIPGGALVRGKVRKVNGVGLPAKLTYWYQAQTQAGNMDLATGYSFLDEEVLTHYALVTNLQTEPDGSYQLDYVPEPVSFAVGPMLLQGATAEGTAWGQASVLGNGQLIEMDLVLEGKGSVDGYVLDAQGAPVPGAAVQLIQEQPSNPLTAGTGGGTFSQSTTTDANGYYRVDNLKTGVFSIRALKGLFGAAASNEISRDGELVHQNVVLQAPTGTLRARLLDLNGQPSFTHPIRLGIAAGLMRSGSSAGSFIYPEQFRPEAGGDGWVTFSGVPAGDVALIIPDMSLGTVTDWKGFLEPSSTREITLRMLPVDQQGSAHFLVRDAAGNPVQGVYLFQSRSGTEGFGITDEDGAVGKRTVQVGPNFSVWAYHPAWIGRTQSETVVIQPGEDHLVLVNLPPRGTLHGTVKHPDGSPVKGAYVAIPPVFDDAKKNRLAITNASGGFIIPNVPVGSPFRLAAVGPDLRTAIPQMTVQVADGQDLGVDLVLPFVGRNQVSGVVYQPQEGAQLIPVMAQVWVDGLLPSISAYREGNPRWGLMFRETTGFVSTGIEGKFTFTGLPQGTFTLHANNDIFPVEVKSSGDFVDKVNDAQTRTIFLNSSFAGELKGVITQRDGQTPVPPDVRVRLIGGSIGELIVHTVEGGKYKFPKVIPEGLYKLRVEDPFTGDIAVVQVQMKKEASQARNLRLWGKGTLTVMVQDSFGKILPEGVVTLAHSKSAFQLDPDDLPPLAQKLKPEMDGRLIFEDLLEGPISVHLKNPTGLQGTASVSIPEGGGNAEVVVRLEPVGDVLGTLYRADGTLVSAGRVNAYKGSRWLGVSPTRMDGVDGRFRFGVLPVGPITLEAWDPDSRQTGKATVNVVGGHTAEVTITTHDKGPVLITVTQEGTPVAGAAISLSYRGGDALTFGTEGTTGSDGKATFYLPPGDYSGTATDPVSLATGSVTFSRAVNQPELEASITLRAVRSMWATVLPPPGAAASFSLEGWSLREMSMSRQVRLDAQGQGMLQDLTVGSHTLQLTDLRGRFRGNFQATLTTEGAAVQAPAPFQTIAYGHAEVTVLDAHGQPASGISVSLTGGGAITTDSTGLARFLNVRAGSLTAHAAGATGTLVLSNEDETATTQLQLPPTASVHGTVLDPTGTPMPYVLVSLGGHQTATDAAGNFRLSGLGLGTYTVVATSNTGRRAAASFTLNQADQDLEITLSFPPQGRLTGTVRDPLRAVAPPVHVMVYLASGGGQIAETYTNDQGAFALSALPAGAALRVKGLLDDGRTEVINQTFTLEAVEGASLNLDFQMPALVNVKGWTLDALGNKIPMTILLLDDQGRTLDKAVTTGDLFDPDHPTFFFRYLVAGRRYRLLGLQEMSTTPIAYLDYTPIGDVDLVELTLQAQVRRGAKLQIRYPDGTPTPGPGRFVITSQSVLGGRWEGNLAADGSALVQSLPEGPATVTVTAVPNQPNLATTFTVLAQATPVDVTLPAVGLGSVSLTVKTASGRVLTGGTLTARGGSSPVWVGLAQGDGSYRVEGLWVGTPVSFTAQGFGLVGSSPSVTLTQHGQLQTLTYPAPDQGSLSGIVRDSHGTPVAGAILSTAGRTATTNASGAYTIAPLPLGTYSVTVTVPNRVERAVVSTTLGSDGQSLVLDVPLKGTGSVRVHVFRPDGSAVSAQSVHVRNISAYSDGRVQTASTDAQGITSFNEVLEGDIRANAMIDGAERAAVGVLAGGGTLSLDLQTKDITTLAGRIRRASTTPWPAGSFAKIMGLTIPLQPDGTLDGAAVTVDYTPASIPVSVSVGGLRDINLASISLVKNGATTLDLTAPAFGAMTGVVKDARGALVSGAVVSTSGTSVTTYAQGTFRIDGLTLGSYQMLATLPNRVERGLADGNIALDGEVRTYNIALKGTGTVRVTTLAADGTVLTGQTVQIRNYSGWADNAPISLVTDAQGVATFTGVLEGSISASATLLDRNYYQSGTLALDGTLSLTLKVRDTTTFSGRILRAKAGNLWPIGTRAILAGQSYTLDPEGVLVLPTPNPQVDFGNGTAYVYVNVPNGIQLTVGTVTMIKNGETVVDLTAPGYGSLFGTIKMQNGTPASGISVRVDSWTYLTTDASGAWRLPMTTIGSHSVVAQTSTAIASGTVTLSEDGGTAGIDLTLVPNTVSLPVYMTLGRLGTSVSVYGDGRMYKPGGSSTQPFVSVDGATEIVPLPLNGIAQWIVRDQQVSYTTQIGSLEVTVIRTAVSDAVSVKEEIRFRNTDAASHRVILRHAIDGYSLQGIPSGNAQPVLTGTSRDIGMLTYYGTILWGDGALAPAVANTGGIQWPEVTLAPGDVKTVALAYAPYQYVPYSWWGAPRFRPEGATRLVDRLTHGTSDWTNGSDPAAWLNWLSPQAPLAPALIPWDASLSFTLKDAFGNKVKNQISGKFLPRETLAPTNGVWTGNTLTNQPRDGGQVTFTINGNPSVSLTRDLPSTGVVDLVVSEATSLSANIRDSHGNPVASANVDFPYAGGDTTDVSGNTGLWLMAPGSYNIQATMPNSDWTIQTTGTVTLTAGQSQVVNISFPAVGGSQVSVLGPNGLPFTASWVQGYMRSSTGSNRYSSTYSGVMTWANLLPGSYTLTIYDPRTGGTLAPIPLTISADSLTQTTVRLPGLGQVQVVVLDPLGNRVPRGQYVSVRGADGGSQGGYTDDSGTLVFSNLSPGNAIITATNNANYFSTSITVSILDGQVVPVQLQLPGSGSVQITLTTADGRPIASRYFVVQQVSNNSNLRSGYTDANGRLTIAPLPTNTALLLLDWYGNASDPFDPKAPQIPFTLTQPGEVQAKSISLPIGSLKVTVREAGTGNPIPNARVWYRSDWNSYLYTDVNGVGTFPAVALDSAFSIGATSDLYVVARLDGITVASSQPSGSITLEMNPSGQITLKVVRANGTNAPSFNYWNYRYWYFHLTGTDFDQRRTANNSIYTWPQLALGDYSAEVYALVGTGKEGTVQTSSGATWPWTAKSQVKLDMTNRQPTMTLKLPALAAATLHLKGIDGNPLTTNKNLRLTLKSSSVPGYLLQNLTFNAAQQGADFVMAEHFPEGTHTLGVFDPTLGELASFDLVVRPEDDAMRVEKDVMVTLPKVASLMLHFRDAKGQVLQKSHALSLKVKATTAGAFDPQLGTTYSGDQLYQATFIVGTHTLSVLDGIFGEIATLDITINPEDDGITFDRTLNLPYVHGRWNTKVLASDGATPVIGANAWVQVINGVNGTTQLARLSAGQDVDLEVPSFAQLNSYADYYPLNQSRVVGESLTRTVSEGDQISDIIQLPLTVLRFKLVEPDQQTPVLDPAGNLFNDGQNVRWQQLSYWAEAPDGPKLILLGQPAGAKAKVGIHDGVTGLGQALEVDVPPLGQASDFTATMPQTTTYSFRIPVPADQPDFRFYVYLPMDTPGLVAPWFYPDSNSSVKNEDGTYAVAQNVIVPIGFNHIWWDAYYYQSNLEGGRWWVDHTAFAAALQGQPQTVDLALPTRGYANFRLNFQSPDGDSDVNSTWVRGRYRLSYPEGAGPWNYFEDGFGDIRYLDNSYSIPSATPFHMEVDLELQDGGHYVGESDGTAPNDNDNLQITVKLRRVAVPTLPAASMLPPPQGLPGLVKPSVNGNNPAVQAVPDRWYSMIFNPSGQKVLVPMEGATKSSERVKESTPTVESASAKR